MKLLFVIHAFDIGGITSAFRNMIGEVSYKSDAKINILVFSDKLGNVVFPSNVNSIKSPRLLNIFFSKKENLSLPYKLLWYILQGMGRLTGDSHMWPILKPHAKLPLSYDVAISFENNIPSTGTDLFVNKFVLENVNASSRIAFIHNDPHKLGFTKEYVEKEYATFDKLICVSKSCANKLESIAPSISSKINVVYNFNNVNYRVIKLESRSNKSILNIVTVCRLNNEQKRIDRIIEACKILKDKGVCFKWDIYGTGPDLSYLEQYARKINVLDKLTFKGYTDKAIEVISNYDLFVLASDYEAYGLVLKEALIAKVPVISTNFEEAYEVLKDKFNSYIVEKEPESLSNAISTLALNREKIDKMRQYIIDNPETNNVAYEQLKNILNL